MDRIVVEENQLHDVVLLFYEVQVLNVKPVDGRCVVAREYHTDVPVRCVDHVQESLHDMVSVLGRSARPKPKFVQVLVLHQVRQELAHKGTHVNVQGWVRE